MDKMQSALLVVHTLIALTIIGLVLLQRGKGAEAGAAFGSGASGTVFGARGSSNFFSRATAVLATLFFLSSLTLAYISSQHSRAPESLLENAPPIEAPAEPELTGTEESPDAGAVPDLVVPGESDSATDAEMPALEPDDVEDDSTRQ